MTQLTIPANINKDILFYVYSLFVFFTLFSPSFFHTGTTGLLLIVLTFCLYPNECYQFYNHNKKAFLLLLMALLIGIIVSELPIKSIKGDYDFLRGFFLVFPAYVCVQLSLKYKKSFEKAGGIIALIGCALLLLFSLDLFITSGAIPFQRYVYIVGGEKFGNVHNLINGVAFLMLFCFVLLLWSSLSGFWNWIFGLGFVGTLIFLIQCQSEGSYLALSLSFVVFLSFYKKRLQRLALFVLFIHLIIFISLFVYPEFYHKNVSASLGGVQARAYIYSATVNAIAESPLVGYGINTYKYVSAGQPEQISHTIISPHQIILEMFFSLGLVGSFCLLMSFYCFLRVNNPVLSNNIVQIFGFLILTYFLGKGMTDGKMFGYYFSSILGMSLGFISYHKDV